MNIDEYINFYYGNKMTWFVDECNMGNNIDRVLNVVSTKEYLDGSHKILNRPNEVWNGKNIEARKIILNYAKTILNFQTTFLLKNPVTLTCDDTNTLDAMTSIYKKANYNDIDFKILNNMVRFGEIYEYIYIDNDGIIQSRLINSEDSYPIYDDQNNYICFIEHYTVQRSSISYYNIFYKDRVEQWNNLGGSLKQVGVYTNISGLPVIYRLPSAIDSTVGRSDLEDYVNILDNMEDLLSKYGDSFYKYMNPIPIVSGTKLNIGKNGEGAIDKQSVGYCLQLDDTSTFDFKTGSMDSKSLNSLYKILKQSLLDVSGVPAVSLNESDISNLSEVSIKMLFSLAEIKAKINGQYLKEGFINRWNQIEKILQLQGQNNIAGDIDCQFSYNIPQNDSEIIDNIIKLKDDELISTESALSKVSYVTDINREMQRLSGEQDSKTD